MRETSGTGFYVYALAWGVNEGLLNRSTFAPVVLRGWDALVSSVHVDGKLTRVQPIGETPVHFDEESTDVYGVGAFLLAGSEVYRLLSAGKRQVPE
jgi:rhamnogalacturonyl hydrolase YesR